jgi:hypothetical protein
LGFDCGEVEDRFLDRGVGKGLTGEKGDVPYASVAAWSVARVHAAELEGKAEADQEN